MKEVTTVRKIHELNIGGEVYHFKLSFMCWLRLEEIYGTNAACIMENIMLGIDRVTNMMKLLSCACVEQISYEEIVDLLEFTPENLLVLDEITGKILGIKQKDDKEVKKNEYKPPNPKEHIVDYEFYYTVAKAYLGYTYNEFWYESDPFEVMASWTTYCKLNGWDKSDEEENEETGSVSEKEYYTIDDLI